MPPPISSPVLEEILSRVADPGAEKGALFKESALKVTKRIRTDVRGVKESRKEARELLAKWERDPRADAALLLKGRLTKASAPHKCSDERIYGVAVPPHLLIVLVTGQTKSARLFHRLIEELDYVGRDLAIDMAQGFLTIGARTVAGVWEVDAAKSAPEKSPVGSFYKKTPLSGSLGGKPSWRGDYATDAARDAILEDQKLGRFIEARRGDLVAPPVLALGPDQTTKIRQIADERTKSDYSAFPERVELSGVRHTREATAAFAADVGTEDHVMSAASTQTARGMCEGICEQSERRKAGCVSGELENIAPAFSGKIREKASSIKLSARGHRSGLLPHLATEDWKRAHFQVGTDAPVSNPVGVWDNAGGDWRIFPARVLNMGNSHSVPSWCRIAEFSMFVMESLLWAPCLTYIDDSALVSSAGDITECAACSDELPKALGLVRSPEIESGAITLVDKAPKILGIIFERGDDHFSLEAPAEKSDSAIKRCGEAVKTTLGTSREASYKQVAKVAGDACYVLCPGTDRAGMQILRPVFPLLAKENSDATIKRRLSRRILISTMRKIQLLLENYEPTRICRRRAARPRVWLRADASSNGSVANGPRAGATLVADDGALLFAFADDVPPDKSADFYGAAAAQLAARTLAGELRGRRAIANVDNTVDCYASVKASRRNLETALLITMVILDMKALDISPFFTHVLSELDIADWATRDGLMCNFESVGASAFRLPTTADEWSAPRDFLGRLKLGGIGLSDQCGPAGPPLKLRKTVCETGARESGDVVGDPRGWAPSFPELKDGSLAPGIAKAGALGLSELSD